jgi:DNA replication licensing factor MCM6
MVQISNMVRFNKSTVYVNYDHLKEADNELAEAILLEYYRFETYLRYAVHNIVAADNPHYVHDIDRGQR